MELVSADAAGDRGGTGVGIEDPLYRRLLCVINARRAAATADWPGGAQALALHPLQVSPDNRFPKRITVHIAVSAPACRACLVACQSTGAGAVSMSQDGL